MKAACCALPSSSRPRIVSAHHSSAGIDRTKSVELVGTIKQFSWTNPHSWMEVEVPDQKGGRWSWKVEMTSPAYLVRAGWKSTTVKPGDEVKVTVRPLRDGSRRPVRVRDAGRRPHVHRAPGRATVRGAAVRGARVKTVARGLSVNAGHDDPPPVVLVVEGDEDVGATLANYLGARGMTALAVDSLASARQFLKAKPFDAALPAPRPR